MAWRGVQLETAITARLYFVLFSSVAKSNNKLSPILPLQPATPVFCSPQSATAPSFPPPPFLFVFLRCLAPVHCALPSSFERFVSRTFPERPRFLSSSRLLRYIPTLPLPAARLPSLRDVLSLSRQWNFFVHRLTRPGKERRVVRDRLISTKNSSRRIKSILRSIEECEYTYYTRK